MDLQHIFSLCLALSVTYSSSSWPYLQVYPPVNSSDDRTPLFIALMLTTDGYRSIAATPGVQLALDYVNSHPSFLPGYSLHYTLMDTKCDGDVALEKVFLQLNHSPVKIGWLGSGCSAATTVSAALNQLYNLTQVSCVSASPLLVNRELYRNYFQIQPSIAVLGQGIAAVVNLLEWKRIALIIDLEPAFSALGRSIIKDLEEIKIEYSETYLSDSGEVYRVGASEDGNPFDENMRLFVLVTGASHVRWLACQAFNRGLKYPRNQFFIVRASSAGFLYERDPTVDYGCMLEERMKAFNFALGVSVTASNNEEFLEPSLGDILNKNTFTQNYYGKASAKENQELNLNAQFFPSFSVSCYEATFTMAMAIKKTLLDITSDQSLNSKAGREAGLPVGETYTLGNFSYSNSAISERMFHHLSYTDFIGIDGKISFDKNGIRQTKEVEITQFTVENGRYVQLQVGKVTLTEDTTIHETNNLKLSTNLTNNFYWAFGIPNDGRSIAKIITVSIPVSVIFTIIGIAGIIFASSFGVFNFIHRKKRIIRLSSPNLNYLIVVGAINFYLSAIGLVIPTTNPDVVASLCFMNLIIIYTGYSLCYGTIMVKMFRVWYIFNDHTIKKKINVTDFYLGCAVMILVGVDFFLILSFVAVQGLRDKLAVNLVPNGEEPITIIGPTEIVQENCVYACDSEGRIILVILLYISKLLLQICSLVLAFWTRKIKVKGLDDSKYIPAAVYVSSIVLPISLTVAFAIRSHVNLFPSVLSLAHIFGATSILIIVFVPRMVGLYRDPTGINVFDNRYTAPNYDDNDVVALRRDVQQLRVTLHFAQNRCKCSTATSDNTFHMADTSNNIASQTLP